MQPPLNKNNQSSQSGSALIAVAAILTVVGVFMALGVDALKVPTYQDRAAITKQKMAVIARVLSSYVQYNNRLPCPADPTQNIGSTTLGVQNATGACLSDSGDVPARTLNLPEDYMFDGWGRKFLYASSPVFNDPAASATVHAYCRVQGTWVVNETMCPSTAVVGGHPLEYNLNPAKARFCCPNQANPTIKDIRVQLKTGVTIGRNRTAANLASVDTSVATGALAAPTNPHQIETPAYLILSFGSNGAAGATAAAETENADGDLDFIDSYRDLSANGTFYDDIILTRTQFQAMAETNSGSCTRPYPNIAIACP